LKLTPEPASLVRVMPGRVEPMRPSTEPLLRQEVIRDQAIEADAAGRPVAATR
jgi:hypothetical protein